ncbi:MAG: 2-C-methyl-D-erythritol 2,4-cyclodiphosphate synthase [Candidatus Latescibacteria bacterium ADurb.Bin168]|nr:MAG: 2-C-methyl-D-erythritol 2,4-cyclodiphosphate synthase [Candidatus Latescibacteria bacterium ADurb.Bin168]
MLRIGQGYDIHPLVAGRRLILGGVDIPSDVGLEGHSDADVLVHAIMDALLGALALGDIGQHFPNTDDRYKDTDSIQLLDKVAQLVGQHGARVVNVDSTVVAERPRIAPHIPAMRESLGEALGLPPSAISVKATTAEKLGALGRGEGIAAYAVALVEAGGQN